MNVIFFDLETSGLESTKHQIIQIGACVVDIADTTYGRPILGVFEERVQFDMAAADKGALTVSQYDPSLWEHAITQYQALERFSEFLGAHGSIRRLAKRSGRPYYVARLAGYNSSFDMGFLRALYTKYDRFLPAEFSALDVYQLTRWWFTTHSDRPVPDNYKLTTMCEYFNIDLSDAHTALADAMATMRLAEKLMTGGVPR